MIHRGRSESASVGSIARAVGYDLTTEAVSVPHWICEDLGQEAPFVTMEAVMRDAMRAIEAVAWAMIVAIEGDDA